MPTAKLSGLVTRLGGADAAEPATDAELVRRFAAARDEAAFAELVRRHGRLVYGVCRRVTNSHHLAEDAFQAVFVVLSAKAADVRPPSAVAAWLHGVARHTALRARTMADRRRRRETPVAALPEPHSPEPREPHDAVALLDEEVARLPDHYRLPVVLCELEGVGRRDAARRLGIAEGTLSSRLAAARKALAERLRSRGVALSAAGLSAAFARAAGTNPPPALAAKAVAAATPELVPAPVAALSHGVLRLMFLSKLKSSATVAVLALAALACAALAAGSSATSDQPPKPATPVLAAGNQPAPANAQPKPVPQGPTKLLVWRRGELVSIDPDGKNEKVALAQKGGIHPHMMALSPDGTKVAIVQPPADEVERKAHLFVFELGKEDSGIDLGPAGMAQWSADGKELAVCTFEDAAKPEDVRATHEIVTLATKKRTALKLPADHLVIDWSRDERYFLTVKLGTDRETPFVDMYVMNRDGTEYKRLTDGKTIITIGRFSPDGRQVLCLRLKKQQETPAQKKARQEAGAKEPRPVHELIVIDVATTKITPVADTPLNGELQGFCWSPDGKKVAYTWREVHEGDPKELLTKETQSHLVACDPDGKNQKTLLSETGKGAYEQTLEGVEWQFAAADAKSDAEKLAGKWKIVTITHGGTTSEAVGGAVEFGKGELAFTRNNKTTSLGYKLDPTKSPKWIDCVDGKDVMRGIYDLDGDELKLCLNESPGQSRPEKFEAGADETHLILFVLKREKK